MLLPSVRYFLALCDERHFGEAARRCGISQPTLTNAIKRLEARAGTPLFLRGPPAELTPLALALKPHFEQMLRSAELAQCEIAKTIGEEASGRSAGMDGASSPPMR